MILEVAGESACVTVLTCSIVRNVVMLIFKQLGENFFNHHCNKEGHLRSFWK
jgi:hypothetical protein